MALRCRIRCRAPPFGGGRSLQRFFPNAPGASLDDLLGFLDLPATPRNQAALYRILKGKKPTWMVGKVHDVDLAAYLATAVINEADRETQRDRRVKSQVIDSKLVRGRPTDPEELRRRVRALRKAAVSLRQKQAAVLEFIEDGLTPSRSL